MTKSKRSTVRPQKLTEFTRFPHFPREIRDTVWKFALPSTNTVAIYMVRESRKSQYLAASYKIPNLLHVSHESRLVANKHYQKILEDEFKDKPVYINPELDVLFIRDPKTMCFIWERKNFRPWSDDEYSSKFSSPVMKNLRRLQLEDPEYFQWVASTRIRATLEAFGRPELVVVHRPSGYVPASVELSFHSTKEHVLDVWAREDGKKDDEYEMPEVRMLTTFQLARLLKSIDKPSPPKLIKEAKPISAPTRRSERLVGLEIMKHGSGGKEASV